MKEKPKFLGCTSMVGWNHSLCETVAALSRAGFDAVEVWAEHLQRSGETPRQVRDALDREGLRCTVHCPIIDVNICSMNPAVAALSLELYLQALKTARELGAMVYVFHPGSRFSRFDPLESYWDLLTRALHRLLDETPSELLVVVENMEVDQSSEVVKTAEDIGRLLDLGRGREVGVCWDITHLLDTEGNLRFLQGIPRVDHVHLSDARRTGQQASKHLRLGEGTLDLARLLQHSRAARAGVISLETVMVEPTVEELAREREAMQRLLVPASRKD